MTTAARELFELFLRSVVGPFGLFSRFAEWEQMPPRSELLAIVVLSLRGELAMSALAAELGAPISTLTSVARRLVRHGYATRRRRETDARVSLLRLTPAGRAVANRARSTVEAIFERIGALVDPAELARLLEVAMNAARAASAAASGARRPGPDDGEGARDIPID